MGILFFEGYVPRGRYIGRYGLGPEEEMRGKYICMYTDIYLGNDVMNYDGKEKRGGKGRRRGES